jgi:hypothetical protein
MTHFSAHLFVASILIISGCSDAAESSWPRRGSSEEDQSEAKLPPKSSSDKGTNSGTATAGSTGSGSPGGTGTSTAPGSSGLPYQTPTQTVIISDASQVWSTAGAYKGLAPSVRANDRHASPVTGKNCLSCHDGSNAAPRFAFGGTVADGKNWEWAASSWLPGPPSLGWGGYGASSPSGVYGSDGWQSGKKGGPGDRSAPSPNTELRIIGSDGLVFESVTDQDGNYWYKTKADLKQPAHTGIRKGAFIKALKSNGAACPTCHESNDEKSPGRIWTWDGNEPTWSPFPF